jgi:hypothetical protein
LGIFLVTKAVIEDEYRDTFVASSSKIPNQPEDAFKGIVSAVLDIRGI